MRYKMDSIFFDLDGTLWNSVDTILRAWNDYLEGQSQISKILTRTDFEGAMGLQIDAIGKRFVPEISDSYRTQLLEGCYRKEIEYVKKSAENSSRMLRQF